MIFLAIALAGLTAADVSGQSSFTAIYDFNAVAMNMNGEVDPTPPPTVTGLTFYSFISTGAAATLTRMGAFPSLLNHWAA